MLRRFGINVDRTRRYTTESARETFINENLRCLFVAIFQHAYDAYLNKIAWFYVFVVMGCYFHYQFVQVAVKTPMQQDPI